MNQKTAISTARNNVITVQLVNSQKTTTLSHLSTTQKLDNKFIIKVIYKDTKKCKKNRQKRCSKQLILRIKLTER